MLSIHLYRARYNNKPMIVYILINTFYSFYLNVTTLCSGLCYRKSVCLSSVMSVRPTQGVETFGNISSPLCTLAIL